MKNGYRINPKTGRYIKIGGRTDRNIKLNNSSLSKYKMDELVGYTIYKVEKSKDGYMTIHIRDNEYNSKEIIVNDYKNAIHDHLLCDMLCDSKPCRLYKVDNPDYDGTNKKFINVCGECLKPTQCRKCFGMCPGYMCNEEKK